MLTVIVKESDPTDNSQNSELLEPKIQEKEETIAQEGMTDQKDEIFYEKPAPKSRGRPAGSKDNKPRIKRVPVQQSPPPQQQETTANEATHTPPNKPRKQVEIRYEEEEPQPEDPVEEEPPPPPKSPRALHKERVQAAAMQKRQMAQARQDHFERTLDNFMGF